MTFLRNNSLFFNCLIFITSSLMAWAQDSSYSTLLYRTNYEDQSRSAKVINTKTSEEFFVDLSQNDQGSVSGSVWKVAPTVVDFSSQYTLSIVKDPEVVKSVSGAFLNAWNTDSESLIREREKTEDKISPMVRGDIMNPQKAPESNWSENPSSQNKAIHENDFRNNDYSNPSADGFEFRYSFYSQRENAHLRAESQIQQGLEKRLNMFQSDDQLFQREQLRKTIEQENARMQVFGVMAANQRAANEALESQKMKMVKMFSLLASGLESLVPQKNLSLKTVSIDQQRTSLELTSSGIQYYSDKIIKSAQTKNWNDLVESASLLFNPWSGLTSNSDAFSVLDSYGIIKGPLLNPDRFNPNALSPLNKALAQRLRKNINTLQSLTSKEFYYLKFPNTRTALKASALLTKLAGDTNNPRYAEIAESILGEFIGYQVGKTYSIKGGKFTLSTVADVSNVKTPQEIAQATYSELVNEPIWILSPDNKTSLVLLERNYGPAVNLVASVRKYIRDNIGESEQSEWSNLSQKVPIQLRKNLYFQNSEVRDVYNAVNLQTVEGISIRAQDAYDGSIRYFQMADQSFSEGDQESAKEFLKYAQMTADVAIGFIPVANVISDAYVFVTGKTLFSGEEISETARTLSLISLLTLGLSGEAKRIVEISKSIRKCCLEKGLDKVLSFTENLGQTFIQLGIKTVQQVQTAGQIIRHIPIPRSFEELSEITVRLKSVGLESLDALKGFNLGAEQFSKNAQAYVINQVYFRENILKNSRVESYFTSDELNKMARWYDDLSVRIENVPASRIDDLTVWRGVPETVVTKGRTITNNEETIFELHSGILNSNSRFAAPGQKAIYTTTGRDPQAWNTVIEEMTAQKIDVNQPLIFNSKQITSNRVLDLTDSKVINQLGYSNDLKYDLLLSKDLKNNYFFSHILGEVADRKGFEVIKVKSAVDTNGTNIVLLRGFE